jgi:hypothetical protein
MLQTRGSSNLVNIVNSVCCLKEYCLLLSVFRMSNITFVFNHPIQVNGRSTAALVREAFILKARGFAPC